MVALNTKIFLVCSTIGILFLLVFFLQKVCAADIIATITTGIFAPQEPVNLAVTIGDSSANLSWSPPLSNGGSVITDYVIEYKLTSGGVWSPYTDGVSTNTFATLINLSNDTSYDFRVSAVNAIGQSAPSSLVRATPGSPAQVLITGFSDLSVPSINTGVRITNEGSTAYEYQYTWCITDSDINLCGGGNDIFTATAAKLIQPGENWDTNLNSTVSTIGTYWFHMGVQFGSDTSYASQSFIATSQSQSNGGGGSSGGSSSGSPKRVSKCVGADLNHDTKVSLIDFSILMVFFNKPAPFTNPCADINMDGKVTVVDFSILLTQWGKKPVIFKL